MNSDQLSRVKELANHQSEFAQNLSLRDNIIFTFAGGMGKSNISFNLGHALSCLDKKILLLNNDSFSAIAEIKNFKNKLNDFTKNEIFSNFLGSYHNFLFPQLNSQPIQKKLIPQKKIKILDQFIEFYGPFDYILINTDKDFDSESLVLSMLSDRVILIITSEPTSLMEAYAFIKILVSNGYKKTISIIVYNITKEEEFFEASNNLSLVVNHFLKIDIEILGFIPNDNNFLVSFQKNLPVISFNQSTSSSKAIQSIVRKVLENS